MERNKVPTSVSRVVTVDREFNQLLVYNKNNVSSLQLGWLTKFWGRPRCKKYRVTYTLNKRGTCIVCGVGVIKKVKNGLTIFLDVCFLPPVGWEWKKVTRKVEIIK